MRSSIIFFLFVAAFLVGTLHATYPAGAVFPASAAATAVYQTGNFANLTPTPVPTPIPVSAHTTGIIILAIVIVIIVLVGAILGVKRPHKQKSNEELIM